MKASEFRGYSASYRILRMSRFPCCCTFLWMHSWGSSAPWQSRWARKFLPHRRISYRWRPSRRFEEWDKYDDARLTKHWMKDGREGGVKEHEMDVSKAWMAKAFSVDLFRMALCQVCHVVFSDTLTESERFNHLSIHSDDRASESRLHSVLLWSTSSTQTSSTTESELFAEFLSKFLCRKDSSPKRRRADGFRIYRVASKKALFFNAHFCCSA